MTLNCNPSDACYSPHHLIWDPSYWDTSVERQFMNYPINCDQNTSCTIICDTRVGCYNSEITCPLNHRCDITCGNAIEFENAVCGSIKINPPADPALFRFQFQGIGPLAQVVYPTDIYGEQPDYLPLVLNCDNDLPGGQANLGGECGQMTVACPKYSNCDIICEEYGCGSVCLFVSCTFENYIFVSM